MEGHLHRLSLNNFVLMKYLLNSAFSAVGCFCEYILFKIFYYDIFGFIKKIRAFYIYQKNCSLLMKIVQDIIPKYFSDNSVLFEVSIKIQRRELNTISKNR